MPLTFEWFYLWPAVPEIFLAFAALALLLVGACSSEERAARNVAGLGVMSLFVTFLFMLAARPTDGPLYAFPYGYGSQLAGYFFVSDMFSFYAKALILAGSAMTFVLAPEYLRRHKIEQFEFYILLLLATLGMMFMVSAYHLMTMYMGLEVMSFSLYILAAFWHTNLKSTEAGLKYFVLGSLASGLLLYGMSFLYGIVGDLSFSAIEQHLGGMADIGTNMPLMVALVMMICALAFKISAAPFHMWTPDVYEGAPTPVTAFMSAGPKVAAIALMVRVLYEPLAPLFDAWSQILMVVAIFTMGFGSLLAIMQNNLKRLLAYSSIGHVGFMLVALVGGSLAGVQAVLVYLTVYVLMTTGVFGVLLMLRRKSIYVETVDDISGLAQQAPVFAFMLLLLFFSLAGVPPLAGFFAKFYAFSAAVEAGYTWLAVVGVLFSVVAAFYSLRIIRTVYFDPPTQNEYEVQVPFAVQSLTVALTASILILGALLYYVDGVTLSAAASLFPSGF